MNDLQGIARAAGESRAERFMTRYELRNTLFEYRNLKLPFDVQSRRDVIGRATGIELVEEPLELLGI